MLKGGLWKERGEESQGRNNFHDGVFMAQKERWNIAKWKTLEDRGALLEEETRLSQRIQGHARV